MTITTQKRFHTDGGLKELIYLFSPILLMSFSSCLFLLVEKLLLARLSSVDMEAAVNAAYACQIFQVPCVALALMAQVCVGRWQGANNNEAIGPGVWQFIWFSFLSMVFTIPASYFYGDYYFKGTGLEQTVMPYFYILVTMNFLYPLLTTLSCFYLGQGKTRLVMAGTIISQILKLILAIILIFGWAGWVPHLGLIGGAISTVIAQAGLCLLLFVVFISKKNSKIFRSRNWKFQPRLFWDCIHPGLLRAMNRVLTLACWASIAHLMNSKGEEYILILSLGGTLFFFLPFIGDALCQAQITIFAYLLGARAYHSIDRAFRSATILVIAAIALLSLPMILFPIQTFGYLFPALALDPSSIKRLFLGVWICFAFATFTYLPISYILASKDTKFSFFMGCLNWVNGYLLMYVIIEKIHMQPD